MEKVNLSDKLSLFNDHWNPRIIGELNGQYVKIAKLKDEFPWHKHDNEDELFYVIKGSLTIRFRDHETVLESGEFIIVPRGVEHQPYAEEEVSVLLFEPASTVNTGDLETSVMTKIKLERL